MALKHIFYGVNQYLKANLFTPACVIAIFLWNIVCVLASFSERSTGARYNRDDYGSCLLKRMSFTHIILALIYECYPVLLLNAPCEPLILSVHLFLSSRCQSSVGTNVYCYFLSDIKDFTYCLVTSLNSYCCIIIHVYICCVYSLHRWILTASFHCFTKL